MSQTSKDPFQQWQERCEGIGLVLIVPTIEEILPKPVKQRAFIPYTPPLPPSSFPEKPVYRSESRYFWGDRPLTTGNYPKQGNARGKNKRIAGDEYSREMQSVAMAMSLPCLPSRYVGITK